MEIRTPNIVLIGMPGCGKSTIGLMLAQQLQTDFYDIDEYIEAREKASIPKLFQLGEEHFRQIESTAVREIYCKKAAVIATGGGIVTRPQNMLLLRQTGIVFYIERPIKMILTSANLAKRPLLASDTQQIYSLYQERKSLYAAFCDFKIINDTSLETTAAEILQIINAMTIRKDN